MDFKELEIQHLNADLLKPAEYNPRVMSEAEL